jgi:hypothetical protein
MISNKTKLMLAFLIAIFSPSIIAIKWRNTFTIDNLNIDTVRVKYHFDTTKYQRHKSGFYISKNGELFQLNQSTQEDENGNWIEEFWLDSLLFYPNYPHKKPLKDFLDLNTFISYKTCNFEKDKNYVYFYRSSSDGLMRFIVRRADPKTFEGMIGRWGKDSKHVFYETTIVEQADLNSFVVLKDNDSAQDNKSKYYQGKRIR